MLFASALIRHRPRSTGSTCLSSRLLSSYGNWVPSDEKYDDRGGLAVFGSYAKSYDKIRPFYPKELWADALARGDTKNMPVRRAVDVACGTGRGAHALKRAGVDDVIAVDLDSGMLEEIGEGIATIQASADDMPAIGDGTVDVVTCLQAFHWLDAKKTLDEFDRILRPPDGRAVIAWNDRDLEDDFVDAWETLVETYNPKYNRELKQAEKYIPSMEHGSFPVMTQRNYVNEQMLTADDFVEQMFTFSYVKNVLNESEQVKIERETRELVKNHFGLEGSEGRFVLSWSTKAFFLDRVGRI